MSHTLSPTTVPESPPTRRLTSSRARDPRLWIGLALVAIATITGARLLASADDTEGVWIATRDLAAGSRLAAEDLRVEQVRLSERSADRYLLAEESIPAGAVAARDVAAGELLHRSVLGSSAGLRSLELPVVVGASGAPEDLRTGQTVDAWVVPREGDLTDGPSATRVLVGVPVVRTAHDSGPLGEAATRQVVLGLDRRAARNLESVLAEVATGDVVLIRRGG